jgi:hypothetical protein
MPVRQSPQLKQQPRRPEPQTLLLQLHCLHLYCVPRGLLLNRGCCQLGVQAMPIVQLNLSVKPPSQNHSTTAYLRCLQFICNAGCFRSCQL